MLLAPSYTDADFVVEAQTLYFRDPNSRSSSALIDMPRSKFARSIFSFGECQLSSGSPSPTRMISPPRCRLKMSRMGSDPPSRTNTGSRPNVLFSATAAARTPRPLGDSWNARYPPWLVTLSLTDDGQIRRRYCDTSRSILSGFWWGTSRQVIL